MIRLLILLFLTFPAFPIEMILISKESSVQEFLAGDLLSARLEIYHDSEINEGDEFFKFLSNKELGQFSIVSFKKLPPDLNRPYTSELDVQVILKEEVGSGDDFFYLYENSKIPIILKGFEYKFIGLQPNLNILEIFLANKSNFFKWILVVGPLVFFVGVFIFLKWYKKNKIIKTENAKRKKIMEIFKNLNDRKQLEFIYTERGLWGPYIDINLMGNFLSVINSHQYKKKWGIEELEEVQAVVKKIKSSIYE